MTLRAFGAIGLLLAAATACSNDSSRPARTPAGTAAPQDNGSSSDQTVSDDPVSKHYSEADNTAAKASVQTKQQQYQQQMSSTPPDQNTPAPAKNTPNKVPDNASAAKPDDTNNKDQAAKDQAAKDQAAKDQAAADKPKDATVAATPVALVDPSTQVTASLAQGVDCWVKPATVAPGTYSDVLQRVHYMYSRMLHRDPESGGFNYWTSLILTGQQSVALVGSEIASSEEFRRDAIASNYCDFFNRAPESEAAIQYHLGVYNAAGARGFFDVRAEFAASDEAYATGVRLFGNAGLGGDIQSYVYYLYTVLLGRAPEPAGLQFWTAYYSAHGRAAVAQGIALSPEAVTFTVDRVYRILLRRPAEPAGAAYWASQLGDLNNLANVMGAITAAPEFLSPRT